jgi:cyclophilin family peptidyl-prolyl cis-trans isomerase/HEAT repeat protein
MRIQAFLIAILLAGLAGGCQTSDSIPEIEYRRVPDSQVLIDALRDGDAPRRARAALAMGRIQSAGYADALVAAVGDDDPVVRRAAWFALGQLGLAQGAEPGVVAMEAAAAGLSDPDPEIVALAVEALGKLVPPGAAGQIAPLLKHGSAEVRTEAAHALLRLRFVPTWRGDAEEPPPLPGTALRELAEALTDEDETVRWAVAHAFSRYGEAMAARTLASSGVDPNPWVRVFAVRGVGRAGATESAEAIAWGVDDDDLHVRAETVSSLEMLERTDLIPEYLDDDASFHVRSAVAAALGHADGAGTLGRLHGLENDASDSVRAAAIGALAARLGADYLGALEQYLSDSAWTVRVAATRAAGAIGEEGVALLARAATDSDGRVRTAALEALEPFLDRPAVAAIVDAGLGSDDLGERATAVGLVAESERPDRLDRLTAAYRQSEGVDWVEIREMVVEVAAELPDAAELLQSATEDPAPSVRTKARQALRDRGVDLAETPAAGETDFMTARDSFYEDAVVVLETDKGSIEIRCFPQDAPVHVSNFVRLVGEGFYDGSIWHRVAPNFVIQGGDPLGSGWGGSGYVLPDEINRRRYLRGTVGMPKAGKDTGGCQIFITLVPTPHLDGNYTVFGQVISGLDVIDRIEVGDAIQRAYLK